MVLPIYSRVEFSPTREDTMSEDTAEDIQGDARWFWIFNKISETHAAVAVIQAGQERQNGTLIAHSERLGVLELAKNDSEVRRKMIITVVNFFKSKGGMGVGTATFVGMLLGALQAAGAGLFILC